MTVATRVSIVSVIISLAAALVAVTANSTPARAATTMTLQVPAAAFVANGDGVSYANTGAVLRNDGVSAIRLVAPVYLEGTSATVQSVTMHYYDSGDLKVCTALYRYRPKASYLSKRMSLICSKGSVAGWRSKADTTINPDFVGAENPLFLAVDLWPENAANQAYYRFIGATIVYLSNP